MAQPDPLAPDPGMGFATSRREFLKILVGGSTLVVGGVFLARDEAEALLPAPGDTSEYFDLGDFLVASESTYKYNLLLEVTPHNRVVFYLPRQDKGQGIATALAMIVADEMDADYDRTDVVLSDARADRPYTITGDSCTMRSMWDPARKVAAAARQRLVTAAATRWGVSESELITKKSMVIHAATGRTANYGELSAEAAQVNDQASATTTVKPALTNIVGVDGYGRKNARDIVTGKQKYTLDLGADDGVPANAVPCIVARPPQIKGYVQPLDENAVLQALRESLRPNDPQAIIAVTQINLAERAPVSGETSFPQPTGVAVAARTFKDALDATALLEQGGIVNWAAGPLAQVSDTNIRQTLVCAVTEPTAPTVGVSSFDATFDFPYIAHAAMEVMDAIADVRKDQTGAVISAEIWYASQTPFYAAQKVAAALGLPDPGTQPVNNPSVKLHVPFAGGAFGRHLFAESPVEAALISQQLGMPIRLLWTRNQDMRHGRFRPMTHHRVRATWTGAQLLSYEHHIAAAEMDFRHGLGDALTAGGFDTSHTTVGQAAFSGTASVLYNFNVIDQGISETFFSVPTGSWRSIYSGFTMAANEIVIDQIARLSGVTDEVQFRLDHLTTSASQSHSLPAARTCLLQVQNKKNNVWGPPPSGHAYGVAVHAEYRSAVAYLVELDFTGTEPRLARAYAAVDVGVPINPLGLRAQMQGVLIDGFSAMLRARNHLVNGRIQEGSFSDFLWARMHHAPYRVVPNENSEPFEVDVIPASGTSPGGAGELGFPPSAAACANAYLRWQSASPTTPSTLSFPIGNPDASGDTPPPSSCGLP